MATSVEEELHCGQVASWPVKARGAPVTGGDTGEELLVAQLIWNGYASLCGIS